MKIEMKIKEIKVKSQLSYPPLNLKGILEDKRFGRNFHNGLYGSLPGFAVTHTVRDQKEIPLTSMYFHVCKKIYFSTADQHIMSCDVISNNVAFRQV